MNVPAFTERPPMTLPWFPDHRIGARTLAAVAAERGVTVQEIMGRSKIRAIARARQEVCRRLVEHGWSFPRVGRFLGLDHTTVIHACKAADR